MNRYKLTYLINILLPCVVFSAVVGAFTSIVIFAFKIASSEIISLSAVIFDAVRERPILLPLLLIGACVIGLLAALLLKKEPECRGGGIPTAIAALRDYVPFKKKRSIFAVFLSSMLTYISGVPLGTEGPSVQMGTLLGNITSRTFGAKNPAWNRYIMTGGACAGFGAATGAPLTGIFFAFEEAHRRFSPMIFMIAAMTVSVSTAFTELLCSLFDVSPSLFHFSLEQVLPLKYIWIAVVVGLASGLCALVFTKAYRQIRLRILPMLKRIPFSIRIMSVFLLVALIGFFSESCIGTGHTLIDELIDGKGTWYMLIIYLCIRAAVMIISNALGITGGLFIPNLAFGAIIGSICGKIAINLGALPREYYAVAVIIGMVSFLSASSRTPITAITFAIEALSGMTNVLSITIGVTVAFVIIELMGIQSLTDTVIDGKVEEYNHGKDIVTIDARLKVGENAFVIGKEVRDILWPNACVIVSVNNAISNTRIGSGMAAGDILHVHFRTTEPQKTISALEALLGKQDLDLSHNTEQKDDHIPDE